jgi:hypothetical protein
MNGPMGRAIEITRWDGGRPPARTGEGHGPDHSVLKLPGCWGSSYAKTFAAPEPPRPSGRFPCSKSTKQFHFYRISIQLSGLVAINTYVFTISIITTQKLVFFWPFSLTAALDLQLEIKNKNINRAMITTYLSWFVSNWVRIPSDYVALTTYFTIGFDIMFD